MLPLPEEKRNSTSTRTLLRIHINTTTSTLMCARQEQGRSSSSPWSAGERLTMLISSVGKGTRARCVVERIVYVRSVPLSHEMAPLYISRSRRLLGRQKVDCRHRHHHCRGSRRKRSRREMWCRRCCRGSRRTRSRSCCSNPTARIASDSAPSVTVAPTRLGVFGLGPSLFAVRVLFKLFRPRLDVFGPPLTGSLTEGATPAETSGGDVHPK
jgi:hypothetical protein